MEKDASLPPDGRGGDISANKRHLSIQPDPECAKKVSPPSASVQDTYYTDPDFTGIKIVYITMIKTSFKYLFRNWKLFKDLDYLFICLILLSCFTKTLQKESSMEVLRNDAEMGFLWIF